MENDRLFAQLFEKYLDETISPDEYEKLMAIIKEGHCDDQLKDKIDGLMKDERLARDMDADRRKDILGKIFAAEKHAARLIKMPLQRKRWHWIAAAAVGIAVIVTASWLWQRGPGEDNRLAGTDNKARITEQPVTKKFIRLPDGSTVLLNEGSKVEYPETFEGTREVTLTGEAYFDIKPDAARPFIVHSGKISTTVLGTAFNIKAWPEQKQVTVTVTRGKVKVSDDKKTLGLITPNQQIVVNTETHLYKQAQVNADKVIAWKQQYLVLDNISIEEAAILIGDKYHVNIILASQALKDCKISATFLDNETLEQVLTVVSGVINATYSVQPNDQVIMNGKGCNN